MTSRSATKRTCRPTRTMSTPESNAEIEGRSDWFLTHCGRKVAAHAVDFLMALSQANCCALIRWRIP
jgi:hypothetical protein